MTENVNHQSHEDEIDLFDLVDDIRDKWYWLVGSLLAGIALAVAYVMTATPEYQTEATITEAAPSELLPFNQPALRNKLTLAVSAKDTKSQSDDDEPVTLTEEAVFELDSQAAFASARSVLRAASTRKAFYNFILSQPNEKLVPLISSPVLTDEQNLAGFLRRFSFSDPGKNDSDTYLVIKFELDSSAELARDVLNDYIAYALVLHEKRVKNEFDRKVRAELQLYQTWADNFRRVYESDKARQIARLEEAAQIAASIGQKKPFYNTNDVVVSSEPPLYMMGEQALRQEAELLRKRSDSESEDVFVSGLSVVKNYISTLEGISVDWSSVELVELDQPALLPLKPAKPRKLLVVALGAVGGTMFGLLAALIAAASARHLRRNERKPLHF
jgi:chain length determinant protein (polysaccharide antigen chain regulator)